MAWFSVDDSLPDHRKVRRLGKQRLAALGVWTLCGAWSAAKLADGFVPSEVVRSHDPAERLAALLVSADLWERATVDGEPGYRFHDWGDYQPSREKVLERREQRREAGRRGGLERARRQASAQATAKASAQAPAQASAVVTAQANAQAVTQAKSNPLPLKATEPPTGVPAARLATTQASAQAVASPQSIIGDWLDLCARRPPGSVIGQIGKQAKVMIDEGIAPDFIRQGLFDWSRKGQHPSTFPSFVNAAMNANPAEYASPTDRNIAAFMSRPPLRAIPGGQGR